MIFARKNSTVIPPHRTVANYRLTSSTKKFNQSAHFPQTPRFRSYATGQNSALFFLAVSTPIQKKNSRRLWKVFKVSKAARKKFSFLSPSILDVLKANGSNPTKVVSVSLYVRDMTEYSRLNAIYAKYFDSNPPVRACVQVPTVSFAQLESIAIDCEQPKQNMHVQSISHWAPANIGPYSQCVQVGYINQVVKTFSPLILNR